MRISDSTKETKVCELIEKVTVVNVHQNCLVTVVNVHQNCLELCHLLPSAKKNNKIIAKFSRSKDAQSVLRNKNKNEKFNPRSIDNDSSKVFINESLCHYYKFLWCKCKKLWGEEWIKAFWVSNANSTCKNYFQITIFSLIFFINK